jgi:hypothetical protein
MSYLIVPSRVSSTTASVWIGTIDETQRPTLFAGATALPAPAWSQRAGGPHMLSYARVDIAGLSPRTRCDLQLRVGNRVMAVGSITTLPVALPSEIDRPFTVLLGSCFHARTDQQGAVGRAFLQIPLPDIKILCGDQVYLDAPWTHFLSHTHNRGELEQIFFETYQYSWEQAGAGTGFRQLLQDGANYFSSDDHEYWNNAPNAALYARDTWTQGGRDTWWSVASALYGAFQDDQPIEQFSVGKLAFFLADTRVHRDADRRQLMEPADWSALCEWVAHLDGPGVLVIGQPVFAGQGGFWDRFRDWNLPDFVQYPQLARALYNARHSVVILTGDVHFGRVAHCTLPNALSGAGQKLIEIISSPLALVDKKAGESWAKAPAQFPAFGISGLGRLPVTTLETFQMHQDHFLTLEFSDATGGARMQVKSWPIVPSQTFPSGQRIFEYTLY